MACPHCDFNGFKEEMVAYNAAYYPQVKPCHDCNDVKAYSARVQQVLGTGKPLAKIILFPADRTCPSTNPGVDQGKDAEVIPFVRRGLPFL